MRSRSWSLTCHKYWQRRDNLDSMEHIRNPKSEENCMCVSTHIYRCIKKRIKRSLKISFSNKSHFLQQIYSGKYGNFESRFLTFYHLPAGESNRSGKHTKLLGKPLLKYAELGVCRIHSSHLQAGKYCPVTVTTTPDIRISAVIQTSVLLALDTIVFFPASQCYRFPLPSTGLVGRLLFKALFFNIRPSCQSCPKARGSFWENEFKRY